MTLLLEQGGALLLENGEVLLLEQESAPSPHPPAGSGAIPATRPTYRDRRRPRPKLSSTGKWRHGRGR